MRGDIIKTMHRALSDQINKTVVGRVLAKGFTRVDLDGYRDMPRRALSRGGCRCKSKGGVLLALASHIACSASPLAMQIALSLAGILAMIAAASLLRLDRDQRGGDHDGMEITTSE